MADEFIRVIPNQDVAPVNRIVKAGKYQEESSGGGGSFASILTQELSKRKDKSSKDDKGPEEKLKRMEGMNQYDARAHAFIYRLSTTADYKV